MARLSAARRGATYKTLQDRRGRRSTALDRSDDKTNNENDGSYGGGSSFCPGGGDQG
jgi:hypothetical protein